MNRAEDDSNDEKEPQQKGIFEVVSSFRFSFAFVYSIPSTAVCVCIVCVLYCLIAIGIQLYIYTIYILSICCIMFASSFEKKKEYASDGSAFDVRARASQPHGVCSVLSNACLVNEYFRLKFVVCSSSEFVFLSSFFCCHFDIICFPLCFIQLCFIWPLLALLETLTVQAITMICGNHFA